MGCIKLTKEDTTSSSRTFVKLMLREKQESMGSGFANEEVSTQQPKGHLVCYQLLHPDWILIDRYSDHLFAPLIQLEASCYVLHVLHLNQSEPAASNKKKKRGYEKQECKWMSLMDTKNA